jgi:single-stranded DNA-specific DHH superfamily exonuclease
MRTAVEKLKEFAKSSAASNAKTALIHHTDADGICSGVIASKIFERFTGRKIDLRLSSDEHTLPDSMIHILRKKRISHVVITDIAADESPGQLAKIAKFAKVLVLDHHPIHKINVHNVTIIKPPLFSKIESSDYCASKLCYDLGKEIVYIHDIDWISSVGILGDAGYKSWRNFVDSSLRKLELKPQRDIWKSEIGQAATAISAAVSYDKQNIALCFKTVSEAGIPQQITKKLEPFAQKIRRAIAYELWKLSKTKPADGIIFHKISSKYDVKGAVSTMSSFKNPHKTLVVYLEKNGIINISARRQDRKVAVNILLENATRGLQNATAGGHIPAAGASIRARDWETFKQRIIRLQKQ